MNVKDKQIRQALIEKRTEELFQIVQKPEYIQLLVNLTKDIEISILEAISEFDSEEEKLDFAIYFVKMLDPNVDVNALELSELKDKIREIYTRIFSSLEILKEIVFEASIEFYLTEKESKIKVKQLYESILQRISGIEAIQEVEEAMNQLSKLQSDYINKNNQEVTELLKMAKKHGLEAALNKEIHYKIIKQIWSTADEYISHQMGVEEVKKPLSKIQKAMESNEVAGDIISNVFKKIQGNIEEIMSSKLLKDYATQKAKEIYNL